MNTTSTHKSFVTGAVGAVIAGAAAPALLFLGTGTAHAIQDVSERGAVAIIDDLPTPRDCGGCGAFNPQPDPPAFRDPANGVEVGNPNERRPLGIDPGSSIGLGGPDTSPPQHN